MEAFINFYAKPWSMVAAGMNFDLDAGYFRFLMGDNGKKSILIHAGKCVYAGKMKRKPRWSDDRYFIRNIPKGREEKIVKKLCESGYRPEREVII